MLLLLYKITVNRFQHNTDSGTPVPLSFSNYANFYTNTSTQIRANI